MNAPSPVDGGAPRFQQISASSWELTTFTPDLLREIAREECPRLRLIADAAGQATRMNEAATNFLIDFGTSFSPRMEEAWATGMSRAARTFVDALGKQPFRSAIRLRLAADHERFMEMVSMAREVHAAALQLAMEAGRAKQKSTKAITPPERLWLHRMAEIYKNCFGRDAGTTRSPAAVTRDKAVGSRGGPFPRFVARVAKELIGDGGVSGDAESRARWHTALAGFSSETKVARRWEARWED